MSDLQPIELENVLLVTAAFPLPLRRARAMLPANLPLNLIEVFPGRAVLVVSFSLYRTSPFGTYHEATLALMASHEPVSPVVTLAQLIQQSRYPAWVLHMLVDSPAAVQVGVEGWALPRQVAAVTIAEEAQQTRCSASVAGQLVVEMTAERPRLDRPRKAQIETYTQRDDTLLHSSMQCEAAAYGRTQGGGASLVWGDHALVQQLSAAQVSAMPLMLRYYDQMQARLEPPVAVAMPPA